MAHRFVASSAVYAYEALAVVPATVSGRFVIGSPSAGLAMAVTRTPFSRIPGIAMLHLHFNVGGVDPTIWTPSDPNSPFAQQGPGGYKFEPPLVLGHVYEIAMHIAGTALRVSVYDTSPRRLVFSNVWTDPRVPHVVGTTVFWEPGAGVAWTSVEAVR